MLRRMTSRLRIQYASDLHLEFSEKHSFQEILKPVAPFLALAGDIGRPDKRSYLDFLRYVSGAWTDVFIVAGNHEFYNTWVSKHWKHMPIGSVDTVSERLNLCQSLSEQFPNVHFLDRNRVDREGVAFLGATLWTDLRGHEVEAEGGMNDFQMIATEGCKALRANDVTEWHLRDREWLDNELAACEEEGRPAVVITHHLPTFDLIASRYQGSPLNPCFASDCEELIRPPVRAWIAGHTHTGAHRTWPGPVLGCVNPRGYPGETGTGYSAEIFVDISDEPGDGGDTRDPLMVAATAETEKDLEFK